MVKVNSPSAVTRESAGARRSRVSALVYEFPECTVTVRETEPGVLVATAERAAAGLRTPNKAERRKILVACARADAAVERDADGKFSLSF